jgi:hypothetical protein
MNEELIFNGSLNNEVITVVRVLSYFVQDVA